MKKIVVHSSEAADLLGISLRLAQIKLKDIRKKHNLEKTRSIPVEIFCKETGTDLPLVLAMINKAQDKQ